MAMAKTTTGSTIGVNSSPRRIWRPRNSPLTRLKEASKPISTARMAAMAAILALVSAAPIQAGSASSSWYHFSVQPAGGNAGKRQRQQDAPEGLERACAAKGGGAQRHGVDRAQRADQRQDHEGQHDVDHADGDAGQIVDERQRLMDDAEPHQRPVDH